MNPLTKRQRQILDYIEQFIDENGYAPSYREIAAEFKLASVSTIAEHIDALDRKGHLQRAVNEARSLQLTPTWDDATFTIPLMGTIAAGAPIQAIRTNETIDIPRDMIGPNVFALRVKGNSMIEDGIFDGDYVIIEQAASARNGDIIVALIDRENVTLKRYYQEKDHIRLQPANSSMKPLRVKNVTVQGKVKGIIRKFK